MKFKGNLSKQYRNVIYFQQNHFYNTQTPIIWKGKIILDGTLCIHRCLTNASSLNSSKRMEHTFSLYIRSRSVTTVSVSSDRVTSFDIQCEGGRSGAMLIPGFPFSPLTLMEATLKFFPHSLQILLPRHFSSNTSSRSFRLTTKSMSVTPSNISWEHEQTSQIWEHITRVQGYFRDTITQFLQLCQERGGIHAIMLG